MPVRRLPSNASLAHLKDQAKDLLNDHAACDLGVAQKIREFHPRFTGATDARIFATKFCQSDAQLTIAREYGFPSWARLKAHIAKATVSDPFHLPHHERIEDSTFQGAVALIDLGDAAGLAIYLKQHPNLVRQRVVFEGGNYFRNPSLLEFIAENPVRHGKLPDNIVAVAKVILDAGVERAALNETLQLVSTGSVARQCRLQIPLIDLLCEYGADPSSAIQATVVHGELSAADHLLEQGARITLPVAAALGRMDDFRRQLAAANNEELHLALALAAQFNRVEMVRLLLDAGEDPNRYNPVGGHSHTTPLHQAAGGGYRELVQLLLERGARTDLKDVLWHGTPADWAKHAGWTELEAYLRKYETVGKATKGSYNQAGRSFSS